MAVCVKPCLSTSDPTAVKEIFHYALKTIRPQVRLQPFDLLNKCFILF